MDVSSAASLSHDDKEDQKEVSWEGAAELLQKCQETRNRTREWKGCSGVTLVDGLKIWKHENVKFVLVASASTNSYKHVTG